MWKDRAKEGEVSKKAVTSIIKGSTQSQPNEDKDFPMGISHQQSNVNKDRIWMLWVED